MARMSNKDPGTLKVAELKLLLSKHNLPTKGKKVELVERYINKFLL